MRSRSVSSKMASRPSSRTTSNARSASKTPTPLKKSKVPVPPSSAQARSLQSRKPPLASRARQSSSANGKQHSMASTAAYTRDIGAADESSIAAASTTPPTLLSSSSSIQAATIAKQKGGAAAATFATPLSSRVLRGGLSPKRRLSSSRNSISTVGAKRKVGGAFLANASTSHTNTSACMSGSTHSFGVSKRSRAVTQEVAVNRLVCWVRKVVIGKRRPLRRDHMVARMHERRDIEEALHDIRVRCAKRSLRRCFSDFADSRERRRVLNGREQQAAMWSVIAAHLEAFKSSCEVAKRRLHRFKDAVTRIEEFWAASPLYTRVSALSQTEQARRMLVRHEVIERRDIMRRHLQYSIDAHQRFYNDPRMIEAGISARALDPTDSSILLFSADEPFNNYSSGKHGLSNGRFSHNNNTGCVRMSMMPSDSKHGETWGTGPYHAYHCTARSADEETLRLYERRAFFSTQECQLLREEGILAVAGRWTANNMGDSSTTRDFAGTLNGALRLERRATTDQSIMIMRAVNRDRRTPSVVGGGIDGACRAPPSGALASLDDRIIGNSMIPLFGNKQRYIAEIEDRERRLLRAHMMSKEGPTLCIPPIFRVSTDGYCQLLRERHYVNHLSTLLGVRFELYEKRITGVPLSADETAELSPDEGDLKRIIMGPSCLLPVTVNRLMVGSHRLGSPLYENYLARIQARLYARYSTSKGDGGGSSDEEEDGEVPAFSRGDGRQAEAGLSPATFHLGGLTDAATEAYFNPRERLRQNAGDTAAVASASSALAKEEHLTARSYRSAASAAPPSTAKTAVSSLSALASAVSASGKRCCDNSQSTFMVTSDMQIAPFVLSAEVLSPKWSDFIVDGDVSKSNGGRQAVEYGVKKEHAQAAPCTAATRASAVPPRVQHGISAPLGNTGKGSPAVVFYKDLLNAARSASNLSSSDQASHACGDATPAPRTHDMFVNLPYEVERLLIQENVRRGQLYSNHEIQWKSIVALTQVGLALRP